MTNRLRSTLLYSSQETDQNNNGQYWRNTGWHILAFSPSSPVLVKPQKHRIRTPPATQLNTCHLSSGWLKVLKTCWAIYWAKRFWSFLHKVWRVLWEISVFICSHLGLFWKKKCLDQSEFNKTIKIEWLLLGCSQSNQTDTYPVSSSIFSVKSLFQLSKLKKINLKLKLLGDTTGIISSWR